MKEIKLACIVIVGVLIFQSNIHNIQANKVIDIGKLIGGALLSKGFDYIWDNETGKADIPELKRRIKELEETVSKTNKNLAEIIREFRNSIKSNISKEDFKIMVKNLDIDLTKRIEDLERHEKITDRQLKDLDNRLAKLEAKGNPNVKDASADSPQKAIISYQEIRGEGSPIEVTGDKKKESAKAYKNSAASLYSRSVNGVGGSDDQARSLVHAYNNLIDRVKSIDAIKNDIFVKSLEPFSYSYHANQSVFAIADLAKGLEIYLETLNPNKSLQASASALSIRAEKGVGGSSDQARVLKDEYNLLIRESKRIFKENKDITNRAEFNNLDHANSVASEISALARELVGVLGSPGN